MLDMGFYDDIVRIIKYLPEKRQTICFSATMPFKMRELAKQILKDPAEINIAISKPAEGIDQQVYLAFENQKEKLLKNILTQKEYQSVLIFSSTKEKVKKMEFDLKRIGIKAKSFHSDLEQAEREDLMIKFKSRNLKILIGTDVLSRGIDVEGIDLVVNYDAPPDPEDYVHRIGRTARASSQGTAITFINEKDFGKLARIEKLIGKEVPRKQLPNELGEGPVFTLEKTTNSKFRGNSSGGKRSGPQRSFNKGNAKH
jgi:superfamily II DNA/RNA helicase